MDDVSSADVDHTPGESLSIEGRMVVSPGIGTFRAETTIGVGTRVEAGSPIGFIEALGDTVAVDSPFRGRVERLLVEPGERLRNGQGVAWLRLE
ncbi:MAG: biotin/lipoyl-containing protein [Acidimicrobiia bacterium]